MTAKRGVKLEFKNQVSPRYIEPLLLQIEPGEWYTSAELQQQLRDSGLDVQGKDIVQVNIAFWEKVGLGEVQRPRGPGDLTCSAWELLGKQVRDLYSTNRAVLRFGTLPVSTQHSSDRTI